MDEYHKINSLYKRTEDGKQMLFGEYSCPEFAYLRENEWVFTEKVDGTNIRVMYDPTQPHAVTFGGKTDNAQISALLIKRLQELFLTEHALGRLAANFDGPVCLYGEGYGAKIQTGGKYRPDQDFVLFDVRVGSIWLKRDAVEDIASTLALTCVPIIGTGTLEQLESLVDAGFPSTWGDFLAEGIVARPATELQTRMGHRVITKLKHKDFYTPQRKEVIANAPTHDPGP